MEENKTFNIFKYVSLGLYILCMVVLIVESCITSEHSVNQSTSLGTLIADFFNNIAGDQATDIKIESVKIDNKIETVNVGDKLTLKTTILPENTSDKSLNYTSSNEDVAIISNVGEITFLKEGTTTITAFSEKYTDIKDYFIVNVKKVKLTNISSRILDVTPDDKGVYTLFINSSYTISTAYTPSNTTDKNVKYSLDSEDYLNIKGDVITPKAFSGEDITILTSSQDDIKHTLKIKTAFKETIHPESVNIENTSLYVNQTIFPKVIINPTNATTSNYILSSDSDIVKIENNFITGVRSGKATIKVSLLDYPSIYFEKEIEVLSSPSMESFNVSILNEVMINKDYNIDILPYPYYSKKEDISNFEITSLDESIIKIANNKIRPLKEGKTSVLVKYNNITISKEINVYSKLEEEKEFTVTLIKSNILSNKEYQLSEVLNSNENLLYFLKDDKNGIIDNVNNKLKITNTGKIDIICLHKPSGNIKEVSLFSASSFNIKNDKNEVITSLNLEYLKNKTFKIVSDNLNQQYKIISDNKLRIYKQDNDYYNVISYSHNESSNIKIIPIINGEVLDEVSMTLNITSSSKVTTKLNYNLVWRSSGKIINPKENNVYKVYSPGAYKVVPIIDEGVILFDYTMTSSNKEVAIINNEGIITIFTPGTTTFTIKENHSKLETTLVLNTFNYIKLDEENPFTITGEKVKLENDIYYLTNGYSAKIELNFDKFTTYKKTVFTSCDENILKINQDGTITPLNLGKTKITMSINDGMLPEIKLEIDVEIIQKDFISNLEDFLSFVRKGIGHFGAFLVFGVFTSLTFMFFFKKEFKKDASITLINGFALSSITEIIQLFVPGRVGNINDVLLDFGGFIVGAIIIFIILLIKKQITFSNNESDLSN